VVLHDGEETDRLAIVVEVVAGDNVRISPETAHGTKAGVDVFVPAGKGRGVFAEPIVDVQHGVSPLVDAGFSAGDALAHEAGSGDGIRLVAVRHPSQAAISGPGGRRVPVPDAAVVLDGGIDLALGIKRGSLALVSRGAIVLGALRVVEAAGPDLAVCLGGAALANTGGIFVLGGESHLAESLGVALGSVAAVSLLLALVVPRNATFVIELGVGIATGVALKLVFAHKSGQALGVLDR